MTLLRTSGTVRYAFATRITDLATNTTLGTATRHDYASKTLTIAETGSRTFLSVRLVMTFRDHFTVANLITGIRMGIKLGAAATDDLDKSWVLTTTSHEEYGSFSRDVTDYFNANFGAGSTQTCVASIAVSSTSAANIAGNICAHLEIVYQYDDTGVTTRTKTIGIPIQSHGTTLTAAEQEVGVDAVGSPAPANQIPALDTYLPEASKAYVDSYIEILSNDEAGAVTDFTPWVQIDAVAEVSRGLVAEALWATGSNQPYRDLFNYDTGTFATNAAHAFKMRADLTGRLSFAGGILWVTYTYNGSTSTRLINQVQVALSQAGDDSQGFSNYGESAVATGPDKQTFVAEVTIEEPGTITIVQSAAFFDIIVTSTYVGNPIIAAGSQAERTYTGVASTSGEHVITHRTDHSSGWALARGVNRLLASLRVSAASTRHCLQHAWALVTYTSDVPAQGPGVAARAATFVLAGTQSNSLVQDIAGASQRTPNLGSAWALLGAFFEAHFATGQSLHQIGQFWQAGEFDAAAGPNWHPQSSIGHAQLAWKLYMVSFFRLCNRHSLATGKLGIATARRVIGLGGQASYVLEAARIVSFHNITFTVAGVVTVSGAPVANGKTVKVFAIDANGVAEYLTSVLTAGGAGGFTCEVPDNTRTYWASYADGANLSRSADGTPGTSTFNIAVGAPDITITGGPAVSTTSTSATFTFSDTGGSAEYSLDGAGYVASASPIALAGLAVGAHTITIRSARDHTTAETFTWSVVVGGSSDTTPPTIAIVSPNVDTDPGSPGGFSADWSVARVTPIVLDVTDLAPGNRYVAVVVRYTGSSSETVIYRRGAFRGDFAALSWSEAIANGVRLHCLPVGGWPSSDALVDVVFDVDAVDAAGNLA